LRLTFRNLFLIILSLALLASVGMAQPAAKKSSKKAVSGKHSRHHAKKKTSWKSHGQQVIAPERAREIQAALIREHYLTGDPSGDWDARTQQAMVRYQADNGWQSKVTPDSRALIKLGLGPDYSRQELLNLPGQSDAVATANAGTVSTQSATDSPRDKQ